MINVNIDPRQFANIKYELSLNKEIHKNTYWISTHPESEERAKYILNYLKGKKIKNTTILSKESWLAFKQKIKDSN